MAEHEAGRRDGRNPAGGERGEGPGRDADRGRGAREEDKSLRERLDRLSSALDAQKDAKAGASAEQETAAPAAGSLGAAMSLGFRVLSEFVAAVVVGALIGWQIDAWTGVAPAFLLVFLLLGTAAGFWNVYRIAVGRQGLGGPPK